MEEEKIENEKKNALLQKQNNLEKLIKLDQKNSSQTLFSKAHRRRLLIRDQALSTTFNWTPNSTEQSLHAFWSHIGQYYFKGLKEEDMERLELLMQGSHLENKTVTPKYTGQASYEAFKSILTSEYKKKLYEDHALSHQNYENLKKKYYLSTVKMAKSMRGLKPSTNPPTFSYDLPALKSAKSKGKAKGFLQEETKQLEGFLTKIESKDDNKADFLDDEIEKFSEEFKKVSKENIRNLTALKNKASKKEKPVLDINDIIGSSRARTPTKEADKWSSSGRKSRDKDHHSGNSHAELKHNFVLYLKEVIIRLENQQAAESIKYVVDCKKPTLTGEKFKFCVIFDEAIRSTESWIEEPILDKLDKMREQSLFKVYKIPQKTYHSINSQNLAGFYFADQKVENRTMELKEKPWKDLIKKGFLEGTKGFTKEELFMKSREFALCHHCKYLFPEEFLVKCTFRSTDLKLPQSNSEYMNSLAFNGNIPKRSIWNNKRTAASFYQKRNGDNVCFRAYCRMCIKQNFDKEIQEDSHKPNWICPFCQGVCNCTRCLRYDTLNKLMSLFSILGGDLEAIKEESYSEKYIHGAGSEGPSDKAYKKNSYYALKPTKGSKIGGKDSKEVKGKLDVYKGNLERYQVLKDLRIKLERIRILCSQVARRERMKIRLDSMKNKILEEYIEKARAILDGKSGKRGKPDFDFIDLEPFSLKKVKGSKGALAPTKGKGQVRSNLGDDLIIKRKRGRPRKEETELMRHLEELKSPLKRGRKKKDDLVAKKYIMKTPKSITEKNRDLEKRKMVVKIPARPRGRPRKVDKERELAMAKAEAKAQAKLKAKLKGQEPPRKRGRPPKKKLEEFEGELYEPEFSDEEEEERQEEEDEEDLDRDADEEYGEAMSEEGSEEYDEDEEGSEGERGESGDEEGSEVDEGSGEEYEESGSEEFRESDEDEDEGMRQVKRSPQKPIPKGRMLNKKKVGRPPGRPPKRPRGRPPKISPASSPAKPRGRPPLSSPASSPGRPRGRPPLSSPASSPPKPRGRPPLSSPASSPGRPRGRPPKNSPGSSPGRPRGRPPIIRRVLDSDESSGTDEEVYDEEEDEFEDEDMERSGDEEGSEDERGSQDEEGSEVEEESGEEYEEDEEDEEEDEEERFKLPRELQGILTHQNADQFDVFTHTLDARRVTRSLYHTKDKGKRGRKKSKKS